MAVANLAVLLARDYYLDVVVVDWDLEAPGLHRFFGIEESHVGHGLIDYFCDYRDWLLDTTGRLAKPDLSVEPLLKRVKGPYKSPDGSNSGQVRMLSAGSQADTKLYADQVNGFDWKKFYSDWNGAQIIEDIRGQLKKDPKTKRSRIALVDSRTGVTDVRGICTVQLPDIVVLVFAYNEQNLEGTRRTAAELKSNKPVFGKKKLNRHPPDVLFLPSRKDLNVAKQMAKLEEDAARILAPYTKSQRIQSRYSSTLTYFEETAALYVPDLSFGETLAVEERFGRPLVKSSYRPLAEMLLYETPEAAAASEPAAETPGADEVFWPDVLENASQAFRAASGIRQKWNRLLSAGDQVRIAGEALKGRIEYGKARNFALLSAIRLVANVWVLLAVLGIYGWTAYQAEQADAEAKRIFATIGYEDDLTQSELRAIWSLAATEDYAVRRRTLDIVLEFPGNSSRFNRRSPQVIHAAVGLNAATRDRLVEDVLASRCYGVSPLDDDTLGACASLIPALDKRSSRAPEFLVAAMEKEEDSERLSRLARGLGALGERVPPDKTAQAAGRLVAAMGKEEDSDRLSSLAEGLGALGERVPPEKAAELAGRLVAAMEKEKDSGRLSSLARGLGALGERLPPEEAAELAGRLVAAMGKEEDSDRLSSLAEGLGALGERVPPEKAAELAGRLVAAMEKEKDSGRLSSLTRGLGALGERLPPKKAAELAGRLVAAMEKEKDSYRLSSLARGLGALGEGVPEKRLGQAAGRLVAAMETVKSSYSLSFLAIGLGALGERVPPEKAAQAAERLVAAMEKEEGFFSLSSLARGLGALGERVPPEKAAELAGRLVAAMEKERDSTFGGFTEARLSYLASGLGALGKGVPPEKAAELAGRLVAAMEKEESSGRLSYLASGLGALGERLPAGKAAELAGRLVAAMEKKRNSGRLSSLAEGLGALVERLPAETAENHLAALLARIKTLAYPPCTAAVSFIREDTIFATGKHGIDLLKWPTCSSVDRDQIIERIGELNGETFGTKDQEGEFRADLWKFVEWAERQGYDVASPPANPFGPG